MRTITISRRGGPEELTMVETPAPRPGPGEIVVNVAGAGVNYLDVFHRTGHYQRPLPFVPGVEGCGEVAALGPGVQEFTLGQRVAWVLCAGSYAEQIVLPAGLVVPVPDHVPDELAAAGLLHGMAARYLTTSTYPVGPSDTVLVQAASGGTRLLVAQLAKAKGARVIATVHGEDAARHAEAAGADAILPLDGSDLTAEVRRLTGGRGVDAVYDGLGRRTFEAGLSCLRPRGTFVLMAELSGKVGPFDPALLTKGSYFLTRPELGHHIARREELLASARDVFGWIGDGTLSVRLGRCYPLADTADAHRALELHRDTGKPVVLPRV